MNTIILIANILTLLAFVVHTFVGDKELKDNEKILLQILTIYFLGYAIVWALTVAISKQFPKNYLKLGQCG
jgi:hypothetical protein